MKNGRTRWGWSREWSGTLAGLAVGAFLLALAAGGPASAASFELAGGERLEGEVVHATRSALMVRAASGGIRQLSLSDVERVALSTEEGEVAGALLSWRDGVYEVDAGERRVKVADGRVVGEDAEVLPVLNITTGEAPEGAAEMIFRIELNPPARRSIFVVYGTFDRTAKAGEDYLEERGSLELAAGEDGAVLHIPLIDDDVAESDETFEVFVSADKELATIQSNRALGTILNDDE